MRMSLIPLACGIALVTACGSTATTSAESAESSDTPTIVVSTNILGDVVENIVGDAATVITIMPVGADPHDFQPSAQQIAQLNDADAVIINGGGFEEGLVDIVEAAEADGMVVFEAITAVDTLEFGGHAHHDDEDHSDEDHSDEDHSDEDHSDEDGDHDDEHSDEDHSDEDHSDADDDHDDDHSDAGDPHFFTDPVRMAEAASAISEFVIAEVPGIDIAATEAATDDYLAALATLDDEITETLGAIAEDDRVLVTNHDVMTYFADRYDFEIIGTVIPGGTTVDSTNAEALAELAEIIEAEGIPAVFSDTSSSDELAQTLALEAGAIEVMELYSESLGSDDSDGSTYIDMMRANAERIAEALTR